MDNEPVIHISREEVGQEKSSDKIVITEKELRRGHGKVQLGEDVYKSICDRTRRYDLEGKGEFWLFLMGRDDTAVQTVEVGRGYQSGVVVSVKEVVEKLRPLVEQGFRVVADYHNHPRQSVLDYRANNRPSEWAVSPSISDIISEIYPAIRQQLGQGAYPRIIGTESDEHGIVMSGFQILRMPNPEEEIAISIKEPVKLMEAPDKNGITMLPAEYTDPKKMIELGIVGAVDIVVPTDVGNITYPSPFE